jgi:hypothetical protein
VTTRASPPPGSNASSVKRFSLCECAVRLENHRWAVVDLTDDATAQESPKAPPTR